MVVLKKKWKKITYTVLMALGIGMITSCYGMPAAYSDNFVESWICGKVTSKSGTAIKGIKVTLKIGENIIAQDITDENGCYLIDYLCDDLEASSELTIVFEDVIDGSENGSFETTSKTATFEKLSEENTIDIQLVSKE